MNRATWLAMSDEAILAECEFDRFRASGPGGQKRNKTESAVRLRHLPSGLSARAVESRSQARNRGLALARLRVAFAISLRESAAALEGDALAAVRDWVAYTRRVELGPLARLLDLLADAEMSLREVGERLDLSSSAVARAIHRSSEAHRWVNQERAKLELGPLR